ncbi:MAG: CPCC family cysteine-rich protein [Byssovorax sp.]
MQRDEAISLLVRSELLELTVHERRALIETAVGEGLLEEQPSLAELTDNPMNEGFEEVISGALRTRYVGTKNDFIAEQLHRRNLGDSSVIGEPELLAACPCCRFRALLLRGQYDICPVCGWEDTGVDDLLVYSGPNHATLAEAQENFAMTEAEGATDDAARKYARLS